MAGRLSEGNLLPSSLRWRDIKAWYNDHFTSRTDTWGKVWCSRPLCWSTTFHLLVGRSRL